MKTTDIIARAGRNLSRAKVRTFLTAVAISVGSFAIVVSLAAGTGAKQYVDRVISANMDRQSLAVYADESFTDVASSGDFAPGLKEYDPNKASMQGIEFKALLESDIDKLRQRGDFVSVEPLYMISPQYIKFSVNDKKYTSDVSAYDSSVVSQVAAGSLPKLHEQLQDAQAVIPKTYLEKLDIKDPQDAIGMKLTIRVTQPPQSLDSKQIQKAFLEGGEKAVQKLTEGKAKESEFEVVAVTGFSSDQMTQQQAVFISSQEAKALSDFSTKGTKQEGRYMMATAVVKDGKDPEAVKQSLEQDKLYASTAEDIQQMLFTFINILQGVVLGFGVLALVVSIFGIINTQYISVLERTQQIGLMKALGASKRDIARLFRYEAAWVGFFGGVIGAATAWLIGNAFNPLISDKLSLGEGSYLLVFEALPSALVVLALVVVAIVSGWLPSRKAARLDPIEALRTE